MITVTDQLHRHCQLIFVILATKSIIQFVLCRLFYSIIYFVNCLCYKIRTQLWLDLISHWFLTKGRYLFSFSRGKPIKDELVWSLLLSLNCVETVNQRVTLSFVFPHENFPRYRRVQVLPPPRMTSQLSRPVSQPPQQTGQWPPLRREHLGSFSSSQDKPLPGWLAECFQ